MNDIKSKLDEINSVNISAGKMLPTRRLDWKFWLGKNNNPVIKPSNIDNNANLRLIFLFRKP